MRSQYLVWSTLPTGVSRARCSRAGAPGSSTAKRPSGGENADQSPPASAPSAASAAIEIASSSAIGGHQVRKDLIDCRVGDRDHLFVVSVLDRVLDEDRGRVGAERRAWAAAPSMNSTVATKTLGTPRASRSTVSCTLHDVQLPQSASASTTASQRVAISWRRSGGAGLVKVGLR